MVITIKALNARIFLWLQQNIKRWNFKRNLQNPLKTHRTFTTALNNHPTLECPHTTTGSAQYATVHLSPQSTAAHRVRRNGGRVVAQIEDVALMPFG